LNVCNISISNLRDENAMLHAKIAIHSHLALIKQQNDHIAQLTSKINEHEIENEKFKFARSMLYSGRHPDIKDDIDFQQRSNVKLNTPKKLSSFVKGKDPMT
jgi:hypothetical protein